MAFIQQRVDPSTQHKSDAVSRMYGKKKYKWLRQKWAAQ